MRVRKSAEERKSEIVEATLRLADKVGPDRLSTAAIAKAVGVTQAAIFRHFPTKPDLWEAVAARIAEKLQRRWHAVEDEAAPPSDRLQALVVSQLTVVQITPAIPAILFSHELHAENARLRKFYHGMVERLHGLITRTFDEGRRTGHFRPDLDTSDAAFLVIALVQGLVLRWSLSGRAFDLAAEGRRLLSALLAGFGAPEQSEEAHSRREQGRSKDRTMAPTSQDG